MAKHPEVASTGVCKGKPGGVWMAKIGPNMVENRFFQLCLESLWGGSGVDLRHPGGRELDL